MYYAKTRQLNIVKKIIPAFSFVTILFASFLLSGSAKLSDNPQTALNASKFSNIRISYKFSEVKLDYVLRKMSADYGIKIYSSEQLNAKVSANLINAPFQEALGIIFYNTPYTYKLKSDGIVIEKKLNGVTHSGLDRMPLKRTLIAPSFISMPKLKQIVDKYKSSEAQISCDEQRGIMVLDEKPEHAETIIQKIRDIDVAGIESTPEAAVETCTKLFVLKTTDLKTIVEQVKSRLSINGTAFANPELNSIIVSDAVEIVAGIERLISSNERNNGVPVITYRIIKAPKAILKDIQALGYDIGTETGRLNFKKIENKNHFLAILDRYVKKSAKLSCEGDEFVEFKTMYGPLSAKIKVRARLNGEAGQSVKIKKNEYARAFDENFIFNESEYNYELSENDLIAFWGFEKTFNDVISAMAMDDFIEYMPGSCAMQEKFNDAGSGQGNQIKSSDDGTEITLMVLEILNDKAGKAAAKYTLINLMRLNDSETSGVFENTETGYLNLFSTPEMNEFDRTGKQNEYRAQTNTVRTLPGEITEKNKNSGDNEKKIIDDINRNIASSKLQKAEEIAKKYLQKKPESICVKIALGKIYKEMKRFVSARDEWDNALTLDSSNAQLKNNVKKLNELIAVIKNEKKKYGDTKEAMELESYLR